MKTICAILLSFAATFGCNYIAMPTDFTTVASGTRANLAANFGEVENKFNPCADSVAQVRARLSNYTTSLTVTSLENLRLRLDGDATATGLFLVEGSSGDSLFRVSENLNARLFGHVAIDSNLTVRKVTAADSLLGPSLTLSGLTASRLVATNAGKTAASVSDLTSWIAGTANQITSTSDGDGTLTLSFPSAVTFPGAVAATGNLVGAASIAATGGNSLLSYGAGVLGDANYERASLIHTGSAAEVRSQAGGTGTVEPLRLVVGSTTRYEITNAGEHSATGKITGSDTIAAALGFRAGSAGATDAQLYRSGANMWTTPDSLTVAGRVAVTGKASVTDSVVGGHLKTVSGNLIVGGTGAITGALTAASAALGGNEAFTYDEGTFTMTGTGFTSSPTGTARYTRVGTMVVLYIPAIQGVSNSVNLTYTGTPASIRPARQQTVTFEAVVDNTTSYLTGFIDVATDGTLTLTPRASATTLGAFTSSGSKGISGLTITYSLL